MSVLSARLLLMQQTTAIWLTLLDFKHFAVLKTWKVKNILNPYVAYMIFMIQREKLAKLDLAKFYYHSLWNEQV